MGFSIGYTGAHARFQIVIYLAAIVIGGYYFGGEALEELIYEREVELNADEHRGEGAMVVFLYSISEAAEGYTEEKTRSAIKALMGLTPKRALVRRENRELDSGRRTGRQRGGRLFLTAYCRAGA